MIWWTSSYARVVLEPLVGIYVASSVVHVYIHLEQGMYISNNACRKHYTSNKACREHSTLGTRHVENTIHLKQGVQSLLLVSVKWQSKAAPILSSTRQACISLYSGMGCLPHSTHSLFSSSPVNPASKQARPQPHQNTLQLMTFMCYTCAIHVHRNSYIY